MKDEALRLALEALETCGEDERGQGFNDALVNKTITAIKAALEAKDEPLTENGMYRLGYHNGYGFGEAYGKSNAPHPIWTGLTDEEISNVEYNNHPLDGIRSFAKAIEAKLKEKNT